MSTTADQLIALRWGYERQRDRFAPSGGQQYLAAVGALRALDTIAIDVLGLDEAQVCYRDGGKRTRQGAPR